MMKWENKRKELSMRLTIVILPLLGLCSPSYGFPLPEFPDAGGMTSDQNGNNMANPIDGGALIRESSGGTLKPLPPSTEEILEAQRALNNMGYHLALNGVNGPDTRKALLEFQGTKGLKVTGEVDVATLNKLNEREPKLQKAREGSDDF
jgi:peptidoglycan hydrolase-like protein with peptidoglycan-binding domain